MKKLIITLLLGGFVIGLLSACGGGGNVVFRSHYGYGGGWGHSRYVDRGPIVVVPPDGGGGDLEAVPLPEPPIDMDGPEAMPMDMDMDMDMGMPEIDIGL
jgi:hypothetical protein